MQSRREELKNLIDQMRTLEHLEGKEVKLKQLEAIQSYFSLLETENKRKEEIAKQGLFNQLLDALSDFTDATHAAPDTELEKARTAAQKAVKALANKEGVADSIEDSEMLSLVDELRPQVEHEIKAQREKEEALKAASIEEEEEPEVEGPEEEEPEVEEEEEEAEEDYEDAEAFSDEEKEEMEQQRNLLNKQLDGMEATAKKIKTMLQAPYDALPPGDETRAVFDEHLRKITDIQKELTQLRNQLNSLTQTGKIVDLNNAIQALADDLKHAHESFIAKRKEVDPHFEEKDKMRAEALDSINKEENKNKYTGLMRYSKIYNIIKYLTLKAKTATFTQGPHTKELDELRKSTDDVYLQLLAYQKKILEKDAAARTEEEATNLKNIPIHLDQLEKLKIYGFAKDIDHQKLINYTTTAVMKDVANDADFDTLIKQLAEKASQGQVHKDLKEKAGVVVESAKKSSAESAVKESHALFQSTTTTDLLTDKNARVTNLKVSTEHSFLGRKVEETYNFSSVQRIKDDKLSTIFIPPAQPVKMGYQRSFSPFCKFPDDVALSFAVAYVANQLAASPDQLKSGDFGKNQEINLFGDFSRITTNPKCLVEAVSLYCAYLNQYEEGFNAKIIDHATGTGVGNFKKDDPRVAALAAHLVENAEKFPHQGLIAKAHGGMTKEDRHEATFNPRFK